ncbi:MAG: cytochrome c biogenesis protein ResB [Planctomycetes bacterium]|nr:cytochrome c biogenesis protein ResB [Planctomycetota bacterium]
MLSTDVSNRLPEGRRTWLRLAGSLWFAAVIMVLLLVAMAFATVYESSHGTDAVQSAFYKTWWFETLLALLALNVTAAVVVRYPFNRRQVGFVITHASIVLIVLGAWISDRFGVAGQLALVEGETTSGFNVEMDAVTLVNRSTGGRAEVVLTPSLLESLASPTPTSLPTLALSDVRVEVQRFLADAVGRESVVDDAPYPQTAVELAATGELGDKNAWLFAGKTAEVDGLAVSFRMAADAAELERLLAEVPTATPTRIVNAEWSGGAAEIPLQQCTEKPAALGDSGFTLQVLRYLPHATVGTGNKMVNASDEPLNPAVEVEVTGPAGSERRVAFARFPDFRSMHGAADADNVKITFVESGGGAQTPIAILGAPDGALHVRFTPRTGQPVVQRLAIGTPVESPWPGRRFVIRRRFEHARVSRTFEPVGGEAGHGVPVLRVKVASAKSSAELWLEKQRPLPLTIDGAAHELAFGERSIPLGFNVTLNRFTVGYYPGENRPRSFESQVTITDPVNGRTQGRVISMNHPTEYGGFSFFQSSYRLDGKRAMSVLSVSRDPGQPVVFTGYITLLLGMIVVLVVRMGDRKRQTGEHRSNGVALRLPEVKAEPRPSPRRAALAGTSARRTGVLSHSRPEPAAAGEDTPGT